MSRASRRRYWRQKESERQAGGAWLILIILGFLLFGC